MKKIEVTALPTDTPLQEFIFHPNGVLLHRPGEKLTSVHQTLLNECGITTVVAVNADEDPAVVTRNLGRKMIPVSEVPSDEAIPVTLFDHTGATIVTQGEHLSPEQKNTLINGGLQELYFEKDPMESDKFQTDRYSLLLDSDMFESYENIPVEAGDNAAKDRSVEDNAAEENAAKAVSAVEVIPEERFLTHPAKQITATVCKEMMQRPDMLAVVVPGGTRPQVPQKIVSGRGRDHVRVFVQHHAEWIAALEKIFTNLKGNKETDFDQLDTIAVGILDCFYGDCFYTLNLMMLRHPPVSDHYLSTHSINVAIASVGIGITLGYPYALIRELVIGALLHDIGHLLTYRPFFAKNNLDPPEQQKYDNHTVVGMAMLKNMTKIPVTTMMIVAQHHEMQDGSGRIFHATAQQIHDFAKIVAVIDHFESGCRFMNVSTSLLSTINKAQNGKLDSKYAMLLLVLLSRYPLGSAFKTVQGTVYKVIATNGTAFKTPVLKSVYTLSDDHLFQIDKKEVVDMSKTTLLLVDEITHSALKSDISAGFIDD